MVGSLSTVVCLQGLNDVPAVALLPYVCETGSVPAVGSIPRIVSESSTLSLSSSVTPSTSGSVSITPSTPSATPSVTATLLSSAEPAGSSLCAPGWYYFDDAQGAVAWRVNSVLASC